AVIGHAMGEIAAAVVAGALSLEDGVRVVCRSSRLMATIAGPGDHSGLRRSHHRDHHILDRPHRQLRKDLFGRQFHRCHGAGA
ncbi:hypothetical protein C6A85_13855, partial [Mycobacterium sp. ITM-2017-0098]